MNDNHPAERSPFTVDRRGTTFLVPLALGTVFVVLAIGWVSMSYYTPNTSTAKDVLTRPNAPSTRGP